MSYCIRPYNKWRAHDLLFLPSDSRHISSQEVLRKRAELSAKMDTTELYQEASKACLWEGCLLLMKCCGADEPVIVQEAH